jgi:lipopolysaccharide/colanic/teichoic acid biosynthesis glycosyltransferase
MSLIGPRPLTEPNFFFYSEQNQNIISRVKPGLSGIGSVIFRNEEAILDLTNDPIEFYKGSIAPYKGSLEVWFVQNRGINLYITIIIATIIVLIFGGKNYLAWRLFKSLPVPPEELKVPLNYNKIAFEANR